jgi:hypothetical protein
MKRNSVPVDADLFDDVHDFFLDLTGTFDDLREQRIPTFESYVGARWECKVRKLYTALAAIEPTRTNPAPSPEGPASEQP